MPALGGPATVSEHPAPGGLPFQPMPGRLSDLIWGPLFARGYDRLTKSTEDAGLRDKRRTLLAHA